MKDIDFKEIDDKAKDGKLTEADVNNILDTMREISESNSDIKILNDIKANPLKPGEEGTIGGYAKTQVKIDPISGEKVNLIENPEIISDEEVNKSLLETIYEATKDKNLSFDIDITVDDIITKTKEIFNIPKNETGFELTELEAQKILDIINKIKNNVDINIYNAMPETIRNLIDLTMKKKGYGTKTIESRTMRNRTCLEIISAYITSISKDKYDNSVAHLLEVIQKEDNINIADAFSNYNDHKEEALEALIDNCEDNPEKRKRAEELLESTRDGFNLTRLIEYAPKCKLRSIDIEKPQSRIFNNIESKYRYNENLHLPALSSVCNILTRHNKRPLEENLKFFLVLSKVCMNYDINNYANHLFIYSALQNIIYLDIYNGEKYEKFSKAFLENVNKVIDSTR